MSEPIQERLGFAPGVPVRRGTSTDARHLETLARRLVAAFAPRRPLVFLDLESTGLNPVVDRVVEIGAVRIGPRGDIECIESLIQPGRPIPGEATRIHGIDDGMVAGAPSFAELAARLLRLLAGGDLAGYNLARFDLPMLTVEFERCGLELDWRAGRVIDVCAIFKRMERRDLEAAVRFYCGTEPTASHTAADDVVSTVEVFLGQLRRYPELPRDPEALDALWRPRPVADPDPQ